MVDLEDRRSKRSTIVCRVNLGITIPPRWTFLLDGLAYLGLGSVRWGFRIAWTFMTCTND